jgi:hypothetical protein
MKMVQGIPHYRYDELVAMPTLREGQADNLKWVSEDGRTRLWLSRCGLEDGEPFRHTVTVERKTRDDGWWTTAYRYDGDHVMTILDPSRGVAGLTVMPVHLA